VANVHRRLPTHSLWLNTTETGPGVYWPATDGGAPIYVHSKVLVIDDRLLRIGSSNLNNRSMGFDSECDVAIEADSNSSEHDDVCGQITSLRHQLVSEHLGVSVDEFETALAVGRSSMPSSHFEERAAFTEHTVADEAAPLAENDLMDPDHVPKSLARSVQRFIAGLRD
jgi:phosphatidylserine/phosphatidylglycerophosphate/cardiolipin synthase-like enzyme